MEHEFRAHLLDCIHRCERQNIPVNTAFLDPVSQMQAGELCRFQHCSFVLHGGYAQAERRILFLLPDYLDEPPVESEIAALSVRLPDNSLTHRDYLGSLMGLGIKRTCVGDILVHEQGAFILCTTAIAPYICSSLLKIGRNHASVDQVSLAQIAPRNEQAKTVQGTVAAMRLDAVASTAFSLSRSKLAERIDAGEVSLNWAVTFDRAKTVAQGDMISVRGKGRAEVLQCRKVTKKGRIFLEFSVWGS